MNVNPNAPSSQVGVYPIAVLVEEHKKLLKIENVKINRELTELERLEIPSQEEIDDQVYEHYKASEMDPEARARSYDHSDILGHYETQIKEKTEARRKARDGE
jgi:hypothetical protein